MKIKNSGVFRNSKAKMIIALFLLVGAFFIFWAIDKARAGTLTISAVELSSATPGATGVTYKITLTTATNVPADGYFKVVFQQENGAYTSVSQNIAKGGETSAGISDITMDTSNQLHATAGSQVDAGTVVLQATGLQNPSGAGRYCVSVWTMNNASPAAVLDGTADDWTCANGFYYDIGTVIARGQVTDPDGDPIEGAWVNAHTTGNNPLWGGDGTDAQGYYSIGNLGGSTPANGTVLKISAFAPPEQFELGQTSEEDITFNGSVVTKNIQFTLPTKTITGTVEYTDGDPVVGANISFWSSGGGGWTQGLTDSDGNIKASNGTSALKVKGGKWEGNPQAANDSDWSYGKPPMSVVFQNDTSNESKEMNFIVERASCTVSGSVRLANGSVPSNPTEFWVGVHSMMSGGGRNLDSNGNFSIAVAPGTYNVEVSDWQQNYSAPEIEPITVNDGDTLDIGTLTLVERSSHISGRVVDQDGTGISGLRLNAFMMKSRGGGGWAETITGANGSFTLNVFPGRWMVQVSNWGNDDMEYVLDGNPEEVKVETGQTVTRNISVVETSSIITGSIMDSDGNAISDMYGWVFADRAGNEMHFGPGLGGPVERGQFEFNVPPGTYEVGFGTMPGSDYSAGDMEQVTITDGETLTHNITVYSNDMTISGTVRDEDGNAVTGEFMEIFAANDNGGWQNAMVDQSNGTYSMNVASATDPWNIGYFIDPETGYFSQKLTDSDVSGNSGDTITMDITVRRADATISGRVVDGSGNPMEGVFAFADNRSGDVDRTEAEFMGPMFMNDSMSDANGNFTIRVPNGTYYVGASLPRDGNETLINPERVEVTVGEDGTASGITLAFRNTDSVITGTVELDGDPQEDAFVWAWSEGGGYNETEVDENGSYELNVTKDDVWHVGVNSDVVDSTDYVYSPEYIVETGNNSSNTQDIAMETVEGGLVAPVSTTFDATSAKAANLSDGTRVTVPANAMGESGETITLNASSTSELPRTENAKPISTGIELTASASNQDEGTTTDVTNFNSNVTISIPYDESSLAGLMITEDDLVAAYWDETTGIWQPLESYTIDKENDLVIFSTSHFTNFAIVGDTNGDGVVTNDDEGTRADVDSWKAERYFKELAGKIRERLKLVVKGDHFEDNAEVKIGSKEAYDVKITKQGKRIVARFKMGDLKEVSSAKRFVKVINPGAESRNAKKKINLKNVPLRIESDVFNTSSAEGIKNVQTLLFNEKFLEEKYITGTFGPLTQKALINFQKANGIPGTGTVGPLTKAKMLELKDNF